MCGITGISFRQARVHLPLLDKATRLLHHRGPNASNTYLSADGKTGMGHTRLSFIDLSVSGNQPMSNAARNLTVTLNGELYNYIELRQELEKAGYIFHTQTDTEVLLHGYQAWGQQLPVKLEGMFAFTLYDSVSKKLFLSRDRFGIKPLYYYHDTEKFIWGSEIKSILAFDDDLKKIRPASVALFLANRYVPAPYTIWEGIKKLRPAHSLVVDLEDFTMAEVCYWKLVPGNVQMDADEASQIFKNTLYASLEKHLRSDVPIGSFLSGGYDSSALVYLMQQELKYPTQAFSIGFEGWDQTEDRYAQMVADAVGASLHTSRPNGIQWAGVKKLMWHYDDPIADISIIPTYEVSKLAATQVKATVSGEGADEILGGYWWHQPDKFTYASRWKKFSSNWKSPAFKDIKQHYIQAMSMGLYDHIELKKALTGIYQEHVPDDPFMHMDSFRMQDLSTLKQLQYLDLNCFMPELILTKVDRASMAHSLEVRVPFLHYSLVEFMFSLSPAVYFTPGQQKPFLQKILKGKVPDEIIQRSKQGFVGPDVYYMDMEVYRAALEKGRLIEEQVVSASYIKQLLKEKEHWKLWKLYILENWWQNWM